MKRERYQRGNVYLNKQRGIWYFRWRENGTRTIRRVGTLAQFPTKAKALKACEQLRPQLPQGTGIFVLDLILKYQKERMPKRYSTARAYKSWFNNYIIPDWGNKPLTEMKAQAVESWLRALELAPKSKVHIRGLMSLLWDAAEFFEYVPAQSNPMGQVKIPEASQRKRQPRILTPEEFHQLLVHLGEPFCTMAKLACFNGLRFSEFIALQWPDVDWLDKRALVQRGMVNQREDEVKTSYSRKPIPLDDAMLESLKALRIDSPWVFASPFAAFEKPFSYTWCATMLDEAAKAAGLGDIRWHDFRHTYRSWLSKTGASLGVQQKLMRHADIKTTMNVYGDELPEDLREAQSRVALIGLPKGYGSGKSQ
jgi:integrase